MSTTHDRAELERRLADYGQEHLLRFWDDLDPAGQQQLGDQIESIDFARLKRLYEGAADQVDFSELARRAEPPAAVRLGQPPSDASVLGDDVTAEAARRRGADALAAGEIGVLLVAGGQGSRLGFDQPKGVYPIGPVSESSLLKIHIEKIRALARRHGRSIPLYLMTSPITHQPTLDFLAAHDNFGLADADLCVFCQGTMPAVDAATGRVLLAAPDQVFLSPDGHGGAVAALARSRAGADMEQRGIKHLYYFQVDNPLTPVCDPEFLGYHLLAKSELTSVAVAKSSPEDKLGNFVTIDGKLHVIEYSDFPSDVAEERTSDGRLKFWAGSIAIHAFDVAFLRRAQESDDTLPFHIAHKKAPYIDEQGNEVSPEEPNALKFEKFIFDLLPAADRPLVVEAAEEEVFAPLKNAPGAAKDTPEYVQRLLSNQHRRWLRAAGAEVSDDVAVEISPLFAPDQQGVAERLVPGARFDADTYLED